MNVFTRGVRNTFRNGIRTFSIITILSISVALAIAMLIARQAVQNKIESVKSSVGNTITVSPAGARGMMGGGEPLTTAQLDKIKSIAHVTGIDSQLSDRLQSDGTNLKSSIEAGSLGRRFNRSSGSGDAAGPQPTMVITDKNGKTTTSNDANFTPPITVNATSASNPLSVIAASGAKLTGGAAFATNSTENVALIGSGLADKNNLQVGSTFTAYSQTFKVVGIYDGGNTFDNAGVIMPLATLQKVSDQVGNVTSASVQVDSITNVSATASAIQSALGNVADVTNQLDTAEQALAPLESIKKVTAFSLVSALIAGASIILLTMVMIVRERRREIGVLKAIGAANKHVVAQFITESTTFTFIGAVVGVLLGVLVANPITKLLISSNAASSGQDSEGPGRVMMGGGRVARELAQNIDIKNINTVIDWHILVYGLGAALLIAVVGSAVAAWMIGKVRPAEVMRAE